MSSRLNDQNDPIEILLYRKDKCQMEYYGRNDWRDYLAHNWGTSPEMKQKEREYNAKYYQEHKDEILKKLHERRRTNEYDPSNSGFEGGRFTDTKKNSHDLFDGDDFDAKLSGDKFDTEIEMDIEYTYRSDWFKTLPEDVQKNIRAHNDQVTQNIEALQGHVYKYFQDHPEMSEDQKQTMYNSLRDQLNKAEEQYITAMSSDDRSYVSDLMGKASSSSTSSSSGSKSSSSSNNNNQQTQQQQQAQNQNPNWYKPGVGGRQRTDGGEGLPVYRRELEEERKRRG